jgi:hypothetical protein
MTPARCLASVLAPSAFALVLAAAACSSSDASAPGATTDAAADATAPVDSGTPGQDASSEASANDSDPGDARAADAGDAGGPFCSQPLNADAGVSSLAVVPISQWCAAVPGRIVEWTCGGYTAIVVGIGADCDRQYYFDAVTGRAVGVVAGCNGLQSCVAGNTDFTPPTDCTNGTQTFAVTDPCIEAGAPDAGPDGAGAQCTTSAQCPAGYACVFSASEPCYSSGFCAYADFAHDPSCVPTTFCACDNTVTQGCAGEYALKPVPTRGQQATCGDGG